MPRVTQKTKNRGGKAESYPCVHPGCRLNDRRILPGERYYEWAFRYGGKRRQHVSHGMPRQSQLTQSKMGEVYAEQEALEDFAPPAREMDPHTMTIADTDADYFDDVKQAAVDALSTARENVESVKSEYEDAIEAMPASEEQNQERIDAIEAWMDVLEDAESDVDGMDVDDYDDIDDAVTAVTDRVTEAAAEFDY